MDISDESAGNDVKMIVTTTEVQKTPLHDSLFTEQTTGFEMMSFEDWQKQNKIPK